MPAKKQSDEPQISKLSAKIDERFIPTGINELDEVIGGGVYRGRITEIWGSEGVGKTYTVTRLMANISKDHKILFIDSEFALNKQRVADLGGDVENISFIADARLERVCELIVANVGKYDVIILDSLAYLTPQTIDEAEVGANNIGLFARQIKHWVIKFRPRLGISDTAFIAINQYRKPIGLYVKAEPPGGTSWLHAVDVRVHLTTNSADKIISKGVQTGHWINAEIKKSKVSQPFVKTKYKVEY